MNINLLTESFISPLRTSSLDGFFYGVALVTSEHIFMALLVLLILWAYINKHIRTRIEFELTAVVGASITSLALKYLTNVHRPLPIPIALHSETNPSFPSLHATVVTALVGSLCMTLYPRLNSRAQRILFVAVSLSIILLIAVSRLYLRVHYMTDILGGILVGILWIAVATYIMRR